MNSKHTPGEWTLEPALDGVPYLRGGFEIVSCGSRGERIVLCSRSGWPTRAEESLANGRLMTAAPNLLKACRAVSDCFAVFPSGKINMASAKEARAAFDLVVAALAKAEGR